MLGIEIRSSCLCDVVVAVIEHYGQGKLQKKQFMATRVASWLSIFHLHTGSREREQKAERDYKCPNWCSSSSKDLSPKCFTNSTSNWEPSVQTMRDILIQTTTHDNHATLTESPLACLLLTILLFHGELIFLKLMNPKCSHPSFSPELSLEHADFSLLSITISCPTHLKIKRFHL